MTGATRLLDSHSVPLSTRLARKLGIPESLILQQVFYWCTEKKATRFDGEAWMHRTIEQWSEQLPFVGRTIERAIESLVNEGLVVVSLHGTKGKWYRVNYEALQLLVRQIDVPIPTQCRVEDDKMSCTHIKRNTPINTPKDIEATPLVHEDLNMKIQKNGGKGIPVKIPKKPSSSDTILAGHQTKKYNLPDVAPNSKESFTRIWNRQNSINKDLHGMVPVLSNKDRKELAEIVSQWGPTSDARLTKCIEKWTGLCVYVANQLGYSKSWKTPNQPALWFLYKYRALAGNFADAQLQAIAPTAPKPVAKVKIVAPAPVSGQQVTDSDKPATLEEIEAIAKKYGL